MARGVPPRQECVVLLPTAPLAFPPDAGRVPQVSVISLALFNHFVSYCPIPDADMTSYANDFALLASDPSIVEAESRANWLCSLLVRWVDGKQLAIAPQKSSVTLFTFDTHKSRLHPQVQIGDTVARWTEPLKSWVSRWTPTSPSALTPAIVSCGPRGNSMSLKP